VRQLAASPADILGLPQFRFKARFGIVFNRTEHERHFFEQAASLIAADTRFPVLRSELTSG
jgi:hypothetical protein